MIRSNLKAITRHWASGPRRRYTRPRPTVNRCSKRLLGLMKPICDSRLRGLSSRCNWDSFELEESLTIPTEQLIETASLPALDERAEASSVTQSGGSPRPARRARKSVAKTSRPTKRLIEGARPFGGHGLRTYTDSRKRRANTGASAKDLKASLRWVQPFTPFRRSRTVSRIFAAEFRQGGEC